MNREQRRAEAKLARIKPTARQIGKARQEALRATLSDGAITAMMSRALSASDAIAHGKGDSEALADIVCTLSVASELAARGVGAEASDEIRDGLDAAASGEQRRRATGRAVATGPELVAIRTALLYADDQLNAGISGGAVAGAISTVIAANRAGRGVVIEGVRL